MLKRFDPGWGRDDGKGPKMRSIAQGYRGLSLILAINTDRLLFPAMIAAALTLSGQLVSLLAGF